MVAEKSALIHIGVGKTGSTSIQAALAHLSPNTSEFDYPLFDDGRGHNRLPLLYQPPDRLPRGLRQLLSEGLEEAEYPAALRRMWQNALDQTKNLVIASEFLSAFSRDEIERFRQDLRAHGFTRFRVVVYIREPTSLYLSLVQQTLKASKSFPPPERFRTTYRSVLEDWRACFGDVLLVRPFERSTLVGRDVVADFLVALGEFFDCPTPPPPPGEQNKTISAEGMILLQAYRRAVYPKADHQFRPDSDRLLKVIARVEARMGARMTRPGLRSDVRDTVLSAAAEDIRYVNESYGLDWPEPEEVETPETPKPVNRVEQILQTHDKRALQDLTMRVMRRLLNTPQTRAEAAPSERRL